MKQTPKFIPIYQAFQAVIEGKQFYMLLVYGGTGNGKTMCCEATVIDMYDKGLRVKRDRWSDIVRHLKELMKTGGYENYFNDFRSRQRIILDDVGSGSTGGSWEWGELEDIIDYRLEKGLFTIVTTNLDGRDIPPRILSRFKFKNKSRLILNEAPDQRGL